jgi:hypothetical protein
MGHRIVSLDETWSVDMRRNIIAACEYFDNNEALWANSSADVTVPFGDYNFYVIVGHNIQAFPASGRGDYKFGMIANDREWFVYHYPME